MRRFDAVWPLLMSAGLVTSAAAQATGLPSFNAPYRAFTRSEIGVVLTFPNGGGTAIEGAYRISRGKFDLGFRGGIFTPGGSGNSVLLVGAEARERVVSHTEDFPLDGALIRRARRSASFPTRSRRPCSSRAAGRRSSTSRSASAVISGCRRGSTRGSARASATSKVCHLAPCGCISPTRIDLPESMTNDHRSLITDH